MGRDFLVLMIVFPPLVFLFPPSALLSWFLSHFGYFDEVSVDHWIYFL